MSQTILEKDVCANKDWAMCEQEKRIKSFNTWSYRNGSCTKIEVAKAGFYSCKLKGFPRKTRCFCCLAEIDDWKRDDIPFERHRAIAKECLYAKAGVEQDNLTPDQFIDILCMRNKSVLKLNKKLEKEIILSTIKNLEDLICN